MSTEEQLAKQIEAAITKTLGEESVPAKQIDASATAEAKSELAKEEDFYHQQLHDERIADIKSARTQREQYARRVFWLVGAWIGALFIILIAQGFCPIWHPFSDSVLIALISSMTVNLIGTLVIVLKYIFRADQH